MVPALRCTVHRLLTTNSDTYCNHITLLCWSLSSRCSVFTARYVPILDYLLVEFVAVARPLLGSLILQAVTADNWVRSQVCGGQSGSRTCLFPSTFRFFLCHYLSTGLLTRRTNGSKGWDRSHISSVPEIGQHWIERRFSPFFFVFQSR